MPQSRNLIARLPSRASRDHTDRVRGAAVDLDKGDQALPVGPLGFADSEAFAAQHGQPDTENLSGTEVAVGNLGFVEQGIEGLHRLMILLGKGVGAPVSIARPCAGEVLCDFRGAR